jgi:hypothetical protein
MAVHSPSGDWEEGAKMSACCYCQQLLDVHNGALDHGCSLIVILGVLFEYCYDSTLLSCEWGS